MNKHVIKDMLDRVANWPEADQQELVEYVREIEARRNQPYQASPEELEGIKRGLKAAQEGRFATDEQVEAVFAKYRD